MSSSRPAELDFETYSEAGYVWDDFRRRWRPIIERRKGGIEAVGTVAYAKHPSAEVLCAAYDFHDRTGPKLWVPGMDPPQDLFNYIATGNRIQAWNSQFEYWVWTSVCMRLYDWPPLPIEQIIDGAPQAFAWGLPGALAKVGKIIGSPLQKDADGKRLIRKFCTPRTPTKKNKRQRIWPDEDPTDGHKLYGYCLQDIASQSEISSRLPPLSEFEQKVWLLDQRINARGVHIDIESLEACTAIVNQAHDKYNAELREITGGFVTESSKLPDMKKWLEKSEGLVMPDMQEETITEVLKTCRSMTPGARRALEIRQLLSSAAVKKLYTMSNWLTAENRIYGALAYCGAQKTGRWAGRGPQLHNLYRNCHDPETLSLVLKVIRFKDINYLMCALDAVDSMAQSAEIASKLARCDDQEIEQNIKAATVKAWSDWADGNIDGYETKPQGDVIEAIAAALRGLICAPPGHDLICSDYSAIEAAVLAMLAGEKWRIDLFRRKGDIYSESAARITGIPMPDEGPHPHRKTIGKVAELASGYQGWIGAWKNFGAEEHFSTDDDIKQAILKWRKASPAIVEMWGGQLRKHPCKWEFTPEFYGVEGAAVSAIANPRYRYTYRLLSYIVEDDVLYCELPSGRKLAYHRPQLEPGTDSYSKQPIWKISYMGYSDGAWKRLYTYGGKLTENATQAVARDILAHAMLNIDAAGYPIVLHVHDEIVAEVPHGFGSVEEFERIMSIMPAWAADWPIRAAGGWRGKRYRKE